MSPNRGALLGAMLTAGAILSYLAWGGIEQNLIYFWDVDQLLAQGTQAHGAPVRLGGMVQAGTVQWDKETLDLRFRAGMAAQGDGVLVHAHAAPPQMFREGIGVVVEGTFDGKVFDAHRVIVKHSNEYQAPAEGERPADMYRTLLEGASATP